MAPPTVPWPGGQGDIYPGSIGGGTFPTYPPGGPWHSGPSGNPQDLARSMNRASLGLDQILNVPNVRGQDLMKASRPQAGQHFPWPDDIRAIMGSNLGQTGANVGMDLLNQLGDYVTPSVPQLQLPPDPSTYPPGTGHWPRPPVAPTYPYPSQYGPSLNTTAAPTLPPVTGYDIPRTPTPPPAYPWYQSIPSPP